MCLFHEYALNLNDDITIGSPRRTHQIYYICFIFQHVSRSREQIDTHWCVVSGCRTPYPYDIYLTPPLLASVQCTVAATSELQEVLILHCGVAYTKDVLCSTNVYLYTCTPAMKSNCLKKPSILHITPAQQLCLILPHNRTALGDVERLPHTRDYLYD